MVENNHALNAFSLSGQHFVVTGASSGLGQAMAVHLARAGAKTILVARRHDRLEATAEAIRASDGEAEIVVADLTRREDLAEIAQQCKAYSTTGGIDGIINTAGVNLREEPEQITPQSWDATLNLNLAIPFFFSREFIPEMRAQSYGRVINIASLQSTRAFPNGLAYGASKGGICQLTRAMAEAWSRYHICCNAIAPGFFPTELTASVFANEHLQKQLADKTTLGRNGTLDDLFGITIFFASQASSYISGQTLYIDGGFTAI